MHLLFTAVLLAAAPAEETRFDGLVREVAPRVIAWRRHFHAHPELSNREAATAARVAEELAEFGVEELKTGLAGHGVTAVIRGARPGRCVALRADMDALAVVENTGLPYSSTRRGVMHACGHDAHTAILLGTAKVLVAMQNELAGSVKLIFQPAEEGVPAGETGGAPRMIEAGALANVDAIFALHVHPELPVGSIAWKEGAVMAAVDRFRLKITGMQSHAAMPWQGVDPVVAAAHVVTALQTIDSRHTDARKPVVVSVSTVHAGTTWNIIPGEVTMEGTVRTHDPEVRALVKRQFERIVRATAEAHGARAEIDYRGTNPATWNDPPLAAAMRASVEARLGRQNVVDAEPMMGGEDFAHYAQKCPAVYFFLGVATPGTPHSRLHSPEMVIDERALAVGVRAMAGLAIDYLAQPTAAANPAAAGNPEAKPVQ